MCDVVKGTFKERYVVASISCSCLCVDYHYEKEGHGRTAAIIYLFVAPLPLPWVAMVRDDVVRGSEMVIRQL